MRAPGLAGRGGSATRCRDGHRDRTPAAPHTPTRATPVASHDTGAAVLLDRLDRVAERGPGRWIACCPAHDDRSPSLSVRDDGGTVLLHCFGGCAAADVVAAVGLSLADLFPPETSYRHDTGGRRPPGISAGDALRLLRRETAVVALAAADLAAGRALGAEDHARLRTAAARIAHVARGAP